MILCAMFYVLCLCILLFLLFYVPTAVLGGVGGVNMFLCRCSISIVLSLLALGLERAFERYHPP